ncbi:MAG TPA: DNA-directed RNA polymerase subunit alpha [Anaerolineales bacterium]|uniref:DNA-directed RNA polymerase subunit alpha n=1 Tax=uncultured Chloroflexi bacterium Rifle_16ft_4_minimus_6153 TaxID=1665079 RepID=A0A0H4TCE1_9CHLR|nr:DNA-directed RNA polymerase subunit alpha, DNA-directed RNA polymerase subunit alpha [uncultured Chloroflexi bacterium Rifle_16ft_4_minimus_6153]HLE30589.1 DNA-directed RNA polymerase subunit alpha [Anaerolineales bacterium]
MTTTVTNSMVLPKIEGENISRNYGKFIISPLESGYGITLGNALRRVLLASLEGAAVSSLRVADVHHEFSEIPGVKEDMTQVILQVKQLRLILHEGDSARLRLEVQGEGVVTAADVICPSEVEIVNPDLYLFTVDNDKARLEIELTAQRGRGYSPSEERGRLPLGEVPVDAIYSPTKRVNFDVQRARVGQNTNYDRLVLEVWTDGTLRPEAALKESAQILMSHLRLVAGVTEESLAAAPQPEEMPKVSSEVYETPIEQLDLSVRVFNSLKRTGITTVGEVIDMLSKGDEAMLAIRNFGDKSLDELRDKLREKGYLKDQEAKAEPEKSS